MIQITPENYPNQEIRVLLGTANFRIGLDYSARAGTFLFSIWTDAGDPLTLGLACSTGEDLLRYISTDNRPAGELFTAALSSSILAPPSLGGWGITHVLLFRGVDE
jgi:hypothetical protein